MAYTARSALVKSTYGWMFTQDFVNLARKTVPSIGKWWDVMRRLGAYRDEHLSAISDIVNRHNKLSDSEKAGVNDMLKSALFDQVWPYFEPLRFPTPQDYDNYVTELAAAAEEDEEGNDGGAYDKYHRLLELQDRFDRLSPAAQQSVKDIFSHGIKTNLEHYNMLIEDAEKTYDELLSKIDKNSDDYKKAEAQRDSTIKKLESIRQQNMRNPYVPLRRFGGYAVVAASKEYRKIHDELEQRVREMDEKYDLVNNEENKEEYKKLKKELEKIHQEAARMEGDKDHYQVHFFNTAGEAQVFSEELQDSHPNLNVSSFERSAESYLNDSIPSWAKMQTLAEMASDAYSSVDLVRDGVSAARRLRQLQQFATHLSIKALSNNSARKQELRRYKTYGHHENMVDNFKETGRSYANLLANIKYNKDRTAALLNMKQEVRKMKGDSRMAGSHVLNETLMRDAQLRKPNDSKFVKAAMRTTSGMLLLTSPAYYIQNALQPFLMTVPYMAGRFGAKVGAQLTALTKEVAAVAIHDPTLSSLQVHVTPDEWEALETARRQGRLDIGMSQEFGSIDEQHGDSLATKGVNVVKKVTDKLSDAARRVELVNRTSSFLLAYRLELKRTGNRDAAISYANQVVYDTHGDYSGINAPRNFTRNGFARLATQFRKFQLIQLGMIFRLMKDSLAGATEEERIVARKALAYTLAVHAVVTGLKGTPVVATVLTLMAFFFGGPGDDDEDYFRSLIGDKDTATLLLGGIPRALGVDLGSKLGAGTMLSPLPFYDGKPSDGKSGYNELIVNLLGPSATVGSKMFEAARWASQGDLWKAFETAAPTGISNLSKAARFTTEGMTTQANDLALKPDDFSTFDIILKAMGFNPETAAERTRLLMHLGRREDVINAEAKSIRIAYSKARHARDSEGMREATQRWTELQKLRSAMGFSRQPLSNLYRASQQQLKRERSMVNGVPVEKENRVAVNRFMRQ